MAHHQVHCAVFDASPGPCSCGATDKFKVKLSIDAPGTEGRLEFETGSANYTFLLELAMRFNEANKLHAQPYVSVERL